MKNIKKEVCSSFERLCEKYNISFERGIEILKAHVNTEEKKEQISAIRQK